MQIVQQLKFFYTWPWILIFFLAGAFLLFSVTQKTLRHRFLISFVFYDLLLQIRKWRNLRVLVIFFKPNLYLCFWFCMSGLKINYSLEFPQIHIHGWFPESGTVSADHGLNQSQDRAKKIWDGILTLLLHCIKHKCHQILRLNRVCWGDWGPIFKVRLNFSADDRGTKGKGGRGWYWKCVKKTKNDKKAKTAKKRTKDKRGGRGWVSEKCSGQGSERNQIRETIMVELMGTRGRYLNVIFTNIARNGSNKSSRL